MASVIKCHNRKILNDSTHSTAERTCNCRVIENCPLQGACLTHSVVYRATLSPSPGDAKTYIGMTEGNFKARYNGHNSSFNNAKRANSTALSQQVWKLKNSNTEFQIEWDIIRHARAYSGHPSRCNLCLSEKLCILSSKDPGLLNKRSELVTKCLQSEQESPG